LPKLLSRGQYQFFALLSLFCAWGVGFDLATRSGVFAAIAGVIGFALGGVVVWVAATLGWVVLMIPLRMISDAPPMTLGSREDFVSAFEAARVKPTSQDPPETKRSYHLRLAAGGLVVGVASAIAVAANLELAPQSVFSTPIFAALCCVALVPYHLLRALLAR
jgi:hypothetical protein